MMLSDHLKSRHHLAIVSTKPLILYATTLLFDEVAEDVTPLDLICQGVGGECQILVQVWWSLLEEGFLERLRRVADRVTARDTTIRITLCCNEPAELAPSRLAKFDAILAPQAMFSDEATYKPELGIKKTYDAIYNARFDQFKRHHLAKDIGSLALIYSRYSSGGSDYISYVRQLLPHAAYLNNTPDTPEYMNFSPQQVCGVLNASRVGLCLSAHEGAMWASIEYVLCGLPVVSTANAGGRDLFLNPAHSRHVEADPKAISNAVSELISLKLDPIEIRTAALNKIIEFRRFFANYISGEQSRVGATPVGEAVLNDMLKNWAGLTHQTLEEFVEAVLQSRRSSTQQVDATS